MFTSGSAPVSVFTAGPKDENVKDQRKTSDRGGSLSHVLILLFPLEDIGQRQTSQIRSLSFLFLPLVYQREKTATER